MPLTGKLSSMTNLSLFHKVENTSKIQYTIKLSLGALAQSFWLSTLYRHLQSRIPNNRQSLPEDREILWIAKGGTYKHNSNE